MLTELEVMNSMISLYWIRLPQVVPPVASVYRKRVSAIEMFIHLQTLAMGSEKLPEQDDDLMVTVCVSDRQRGCIGSRSFGPRLG
jgi:hypothetical protein